LGLEGEAGLALGGSEEELLAPEAAGEKAVVEFFTEGVREAGDFSISCHRF